MSGIVCTCTYLFKPWIGPSSSFSSLIWFPLVLSRYIDVRRKLFIEITVSWMGFDIFMNGIEVRISSNITHRRPRLVSSSWTSTSSVETLLIRGKIHWWNSWGKKHGRCRRRRRLYAFISSDYCSFRCSLSNLASILQNHIGNVVYTPSHY